MTRIPLRTIAVATWAVLLVGCSGGSTPPTSAVTTSGATADPPLTTQSTVSVPEPTEPPPSAVATALSSWADANQVVGAVAVVVDAAGNTEAVAYGWADREEGVVSRPGVPYRIGSITKLYTAALVFQLAEQGMIDLDDPASTFIDGLPPEVTVAHLLSHTSGLRDVDIVAGILEAVEEGDELTSTGDAVAETARRGLAFEPGTQQSYSSIGYLALGRIIEAVTERPFSDAVHDFILVPQSLEATTVEAADSPIPVPYERLGPGPAISLARFPTSNLAAGAGAAGALVATGDDVANFVRALFGGDIVSDESLAAMLDTTAARRDYGFGVSVYRLEDTVLYGHNGRTIGFASSVRHDPDTNVTAVVLSNDGGAPTDELANLLTLTLASGD